MGLFSKSMATKKEEEFSKRIDSAKQHAFDLTKRVEERLSKPLDALDKKIDKYLRKKAADEEISMATPQDYERAEEFRGHRKSKDD